MTVLNRKSDTHEERFMHLDVDNHPRIKKATVFLRKEGDVWYMSVAMCHVSDQFCRATGRKVARRRYFRDGHDAEVGAKFTPGEVVKLASRVISETWA